MLRAATNCSFAACMRTFVRPFSRLPSTLILSTPARLVFCVYFGTYATANTIDTITSQMKNHPPETIGSSTPKFIGTAIVSTGLTVYKDSQMARILGRHSAATVVPTTTYALFTIRDAITIYASFNLPSLLAPKFASLPEPVKNKLGLLLQSESARLKTAQFLLPAAIQLVTTPIHLIGLDFYNRRHTTRSAERFHRVIRDFGIAVPARVARIVPAFGVGSVLNTSVRTALMKNPWDR